MYPDLFGMPNLLGAMPNLLNNMLASAGATPVPNPLSSAIANPMSSQLSAVPSGASSLPGMAGMAAAAAYAAVPQSAVVPDGVYAGHDWGYQPAVNPVSSMTSSTYEYAAAVAAANPQAVPAGAWTAATGNYVSGAALPAAAPTYVTTASSPYVQSPQMQAYAGPTSSYATSAVVPDGVYSAPVAYDMPTVTYTTPSGSAAVAQPAALASYVAQPQGANVTMQYGTYAASTATLQQPHVATPVVLTSHTPAGSTAIPQAGSAIAYSPYPQGRRLY